MEKITIIGSGGSGKSTLAKELGEKLKIKVFYLNKIWWLNDKEHISDEEFKKIQKDIIENNDKFIFGWGLMIKIFIKMIIQLQEQK